MSFKASKSVHGVRSYPPLPQEGDGVSLEKEITFLNILHPHLPNTLHPMIEQEKFHACSK
jgi:hypothetical protein